MDPIEKATEKIVKIFDVTIKEVSVETKSIVAVVSTNKTDRHGDIVAPESFKKRMKHYKDHPVLLSSHDYYDLRKQIGEATKLTVTDTGLEATFKYYAGEGNPEADWAWVLAQKKIAAFSIGFMRHEMEWIKEKDENGNEVITGRKFTDVELLEISQVLVPANRQSLQEKSDFLQESGKIAELVGKALTSGEIVEQVVEVKKNEDVKVEPAKEPEVKQTHYSETILEDGPQEALSHSDKDALKGAINDAVKDALK